MISASLQVTLWSTCNLPWGTVELKKHTLKVFGDPVL